MHASSEFDRLAITKASGTRSNAAHPCEKRKDGAPSVKNGAGGNQGRRASRPVNIVDDGKYIYAIVNFIGGIDGGVYHPQTSERYSRVQSLLYPQDWRAGWNGQQPVLSGRGPRAL